MGVLDDIKTLTGQDQKNTEPPKPTAPIKKILIAEDEKALRDLYIDLLTGEGFELIPAENGEKGLELATSQKPDLVLLDLMMPVMDGKEMLRRLREIPEFKTLPVIVLTNAGEVDNIRQTQFFDNASDFLIKSNVTPEEVVRKVRMHLGQATA